MPNILTYVFLVGTFILGWLYCFHGYKSLRFYVGVYAFFVGATWVYGLLNSAPTGLSAGWLAGISIFAGIALAFLAFRFIRFAIFLAGGLMGVAVYRIVSGLNPVFFGSLNGGMSFLAGVIFFVVFGAIALAAQKHFIIWGTAVWGAYTAVAAAGVLAGVISTPAYASRITLGSSLSSMQPYSIYDGMPSAVPMVLLIVLAILGILRQYRGARHKNSRRA